MVSESQIQKLESFFGTELQQQVPLDRYSVMQVGGPADYLVEIDDSTSLEEAAVFLWEEDIPYLMIGGGANMLISDAGVRGLVLINQANKIRFLDQEGEEPRVWAESGASFGILARRTGAKGWSGLEWAAGIPGTVGGAVVGNAGAHGSDTASDLLLAEILHHKDDKVEKETWKPEDFKYEYRGSILKSGEVDAVVLNAVFKLQRSTPEAVKAEITRISEKRQSTQPQGASLGSMFKNPPDDYAGRLIEQAGLKGTRVGGAEISQVHANFFLNRGDATAEDIFQLIQLAKKQVAEQFQVQLELEILLIGDWNKDKHDS